MIVLGFDTSTAATTVALHLSDGRTTQARDDPPAGAHPGHATRLLDMAHELLAAAGVRWGEIERIAVGVGPGTFTGLRVGVATARGLTQALRVQAVGVSSLQALAAPALNAERVTAGGEQGGVLAVIDARRGEVFAAAYTHRDDGAPGELAGPRALAPRDLPGVITEAERACDRVPPHWLAVGDGALRFREQFQACAIRVAPEHSPLHRVSAAAVCELGLLARNASLQAIVPDYRRRPDAELALEVAGAGEAR